MAGFYEQCNLFMVIINIEDRKMNRMRIISDDFIHYGSA